MSGTGTLAPGMIISSIRENVEEMRRNRGWILLLGICLIVIGCLAISSALVATLATMMFVGLMMMFGGILEVMAAFWARHWGGFFLGLLMGVLLFMAGLITTQHPGEAGLLFTLMISLLFMTGGLVRIITAISLRFTNWGWVLLSGVITLLLGIMIWRQWPVSGFWVIGTFVGIDLIFSGWNYVALASWLRRTKPAAA